LHYFAPAAVSLNSIELKVVITVAVIDPVSNYVIFHGCVVAYFLTPTAVCLNSIELKVVITVVVIDPVADYINVKREVIVYFLTSAAICFDLINIENVIIVLVLNPVALSGSNSLVNDISDAIAPLILLMSLSYSFRF
jgi:hypothetical protein